MKILISLLIASTVCSTLADEIETHRFDEAGAYQPAGQPNLPPKLLVFAETPIRLDFPGLAADWKPAVQIHQLTSARKVSLEATAAQMIAGIWQWTWTPPKTNGPAQYEILFDGEPKRTIHIETRNLAWKKATLEMLSNQADWDAKGLSPEERAALGKLGLKPTNSSNIKNGIASLLMIPHQGDAARRRVVWDEQALSLVVWRPGPATGDLEVRAPRWWISPEALATDEGLIRFLDLFSEPPLNP